MEAIGGLIPLGAMMGSSKKLGDLKFLGTYIGSFFYYFQFFLLFVFVIILILGFIRLIKFLYRRKLKKALILFHRLDTELFLLKNISKIKDDKKLYIDLSSRESISLLKNMIDTRFFVNTLGLHNCKRMIDGLEMIREKGVDINIQIDFVNNWIKLVKSILC